jgi:hypothetical protein
MDEICSIRMKMNNDKTIHLWDEKYYYGPWMNFGFSRINIFMDEKNHERCVK